MGVENLLVVEVPVEVEDIINNTAQVYNGPSAVGMFNKRRAVR